MGAGLGDRAALNNFMQSVAPFDMATCMGYTGIEPFAKKPVKIASKSQDRKLQRALMQFFRPENWYAKR